MPEISEGAAKQGALWAIRAQDWIEIQERIEHEVWRAALNFAGAGPGVRLLDAGCGAGGCCLLARERGALVSGFDVTPELLAAARLRLPGADLRYGELEDVPFPDASFDAVLAINTLQFTQNPKRAGRELARVTAPGGCVVAASWAIDHCEQRRVFDAILALFEKPPKGRGVFALAAPGELEALFEGLSLVTHEIDGASVYPDMDTAVRGQMAAGPSQRCVQIFGEEKVDAAVRGAMESFVRSDGVVEMKNRFRVVVARKSAAGS